MSLTFNLLAELKRGIEESLRPEFIAAANSFEAGGPGSGRHKGIAPNVPFGKAHECQTNSSRVYKTKGYQVVIGRIRPKDIKKGNPKGTGYNHAWNITPEGLLHDSTLGSEEAKKYTYTPIKILDPKTSRSGVAIDRVFYSKEMKAEGTQDKFKLEGHTVFQGFKIAVENKKGSVRSGKEPNGKPWSIKMPFDYGYIKGTKGTDGDEVDVFIGPDKDAKYVYIVHQHVNGKEDNYDEDKCMLGFSTADAAKKAYHSAYNNVDLFTSMTMLSVKEFKKKLKQYAGGKIHAALQAGGPGSGRHKDWATDEEKNLYEHDSCWEYAVGLHKHTGYPLAVLRVGKDHPDANEGEPVHAFVQHPSGSYIDIAGHHTKEQMMHKYGGEELGEGAKIETSKDNPKVENEVYGLTWSKDSQKDAAKIASKQAKQMGLKKQMSGGGPGSGRHKEILDSTRVALWNELGNKAKAKGAVPDAHGNISDVYKRKIWNSLALAKQSALLDNVMNKMRLHKSAAALLPNARARVKANVMSRINVDISSPIEENKTNKFLKSLSSGGPGSGRHKSLFTLTREERLAEQRRLAVEKRKELAKQGKSARGKEIHSDRQKRALASTNAAKKEHQDLAEQTEIDVADTTKGVKQPDNSPFDVLVKDRKGRQHGIEVKAILYQKNNKITIKGKALARKLKFAKQNKLYKIHVVAVDYRQNPKNPIVLHREGVGSFILPGMTKVKGRLKGLATHLNLR